MYQKEIDIEFLNIANSVAEWSITRYGYFVNSHVDKVDTVTAFADELSRLPSDCLSYVDKAKNQWIDQGHPRPPQMADFLATLRAFNNEALNNREKPKQLDNRVDYAGRWDAATTDEQKLAYMSRTFDQHRTPPATKYFIANHFRDVGWPEKKVRGVVYGRV